jgi:hypothetical protein
MDDQRANREGSGIIFRKLRIAWSVGWGLACVLLIVLWVRSHWWVDEVKELNSRHWQQLTSCQGWIHLRRGGSLFDPYDRWNVYSNRISDVGSVSLPRAFKWKIMPAPQVSLPHWFLALLCSALAAFPWMRFSLRTLLIATTLVAVVLAFWFTRRENS